MHEFFQHHSIWLLPILIFLARVTDVSIGTLRIVFLSRGMKFIASAAAFLEVSVWLLAIGQIMQNITAWQNFIAYAGGFACGNYVGLWLEEKLAVGLLAVMIITKNGADSLVEALKAQQYGLTRVAARGISGKTRMIFLVIRRKSLQRLLCIIRAEEPTAFVTVQDVRNVNGGFFPANTRPRSRFLSGIFSPLRKGK
jgi:uncharacterized protein YebE (UPF0316 family)